MIEFVVFHPCTFFVRVRREKTSFNETSIELFFFQINSKIMTNYPHCGEIDFKLFTHNSNCSYHHRRRWWQHSSWLLLQNFWSVFRRFLTFNGQNSEGPFLERSFKMEFSVLLIYVMTCVQMKNMQKGKKILCRQPMQ